MIMPSLIKYQDDAKEMMLTNPTTAQSVASSMLNPLGEGASNQVELHLARIGATSCLDRSYIFLVSELV